MIPKKDPPERGRCTNQATHNICCMLCSDRHSSASHQVSFRKGPQPSHQGPALEAFLLTVLDWVVVADMFVFNLDLR